MNSFFHVVFLSLMALMLILLKSSEMQTSLTGTLYLRNDYSENFGFDVEFVFWCPAAS